MDYTSIEEQFLHGISAHEAHKAKIDHHFCITDMIAVLCAVAWKTVRKSVPSGLM